MKEIKIDVSRLGFPIAPVAVRRGCAYSLRFSGVPREVTRVQVSVIAPDGAALNPVPCSERSGFVWQADFSPVVFPAAGNGFYEVWGVNEAGEKFALGRGVLTVYPFDSADMLPVSPSGAQIITAIPDASGRLHKVVAVEVDGEFTWQIED